MYTFYVFMLSIVISYVPVYYYPYTCYMFTFTLITILFCCCPCLSSLPSKKHS